MNKRRMTALSVHCAVCKFMPFPVALVKKVQVNSVVVWLRRFVPEVDGSPENGRMSACPKIKKWGIPSSQPFNNKCNVNGTNSHYF